jgi:ribose 5-phosphate isomerase A
MTADLQSASSAERPSEAPRARADRAKAAAAREAAEMVEEGMRVGLGTGSTAAHLVARLGERAREGLRFTAVATSEATARLARDAGLSTRTLDEAGWLDLTIDGADEFDPDLALIKGAGGALLREKIVAACSDRMVVIADPSKRVETLGAFPLSVEVVPFGWSVTKALLEEAMAGLGLGKVEARPRIRGGRAFETDGGNRVLDLHLGRIENPGRTSVAINQIPGVVENGLFVDLCDAVVIGHPDGRTELVERMGGAAPAAEDNAFADM